MGSIIFDSQTKEYDQPSRTYDGELVVINGGIGHVSEFSKLRAGPRRAISVPHRKDA